jgi:hypothetical protein
VDVKGFVKKTPLARWARRWRKPPQPAPIPKQGPEGIKEVGHRKYVGGIREEHGRRRFDFLVSQGLLPRHDLLDIACGSLRAGIHLIHYLGPATTWGSRRKRT